jgi:hypothetical protein
VIVVVARVQELAVVGRLESRQGQAVLSLGIAVPTAPQLARYVGTVAVAGTLLAKSELQKGIALDVWAFRAL